MVLLSFSGCKQPVKITGETSASSVYQETSVPQTFDYARTFVSVGAHLYYFSGYDHMGDTIINRVDRYSLENGTCTGTFLPISSFWAAEENTVTFYTGDTQPGFYIPDRFPAFLNVTFSPSNDFCYTENKILPLALLSDGYVTNNLDFTPESVLPQTHRNTVIHDISPVYEGVRILMSRPKGQMTAGNTVTSTYAWMRADYDEQTHSMRLLLPRMDSEVPVGPIVAEGVFVDRAELVKDESGYVVMLYLTEHARAYTLQNGYVYSPDHLEDGQSHYTYFAVTFTEEDGVVLP